MHPDKKFERIKTQIPGNALRWVLPQSTRASRACGHNIVARGSARDLRLRGAHTIHSACSCISLFAIAEAPWTELKMICHPVSIEDELGTRAFRRCTNWNVASVPYTVISIEEKECVKLGGRI